MKSSSRFTLHHALSAVALGLILSGFAHAQDQIVLKDGRTQQTKILGTNASGILIQVGSGQSAVPFASVALVSMTPPADFNAGMKAFAAKDYPGAVSALNTLAAKFRGLPVDWVQQAMTTVGDAYLAMGDFKNADSAYTALEKAYPGRAGLLVGVGRARIDFAKKDYAAAKQKLEPIAENALKEKTVSKDYATAYSQTFCLLGQIEEAAGNDSAALEDYLRTVTLFYKDSVAVNTAQQRADVLQKERHVVVP